MQTLKQRSSDSPDPRRTEHTKTELEGAGKKPCPRRRVKIASCARYEAFMQELAADYQRLLSDGDE
jgi:hypothetical protein